VRFLIDANLPPVLVRWLVEQGHEANHVSDFALASASDRDIWRHARETDACIVTKDEDFVLLHAVDRRGPPVVWIRIGNATRDALLHRLSPLWLGVVEALERGETIVEVV
jgi:predicted nuclease of predicted toxin-antitoxin system